MNNFNISPKDVAAPESAAPVQPKPAASVNVASERSMAAEAIRVQPANKAAIISSFEDRTGQKY
jgi:hypothetical protein